MAILIEGISVVIQAGKLLDAFGSFDGFASIVPNSTLCSDGEIARVGFMTPEDVRPFVERLKAAGLQYVQGGEAQDLCVVDQREGPLESCSWLHFSHVAISQYGRQKVASCRLVGGTAENLAVPDGWSFDKSLSASHLFVPLEHAATLTPVGKIGNVEVFRSAISSKPMFMGRTNQKWGADPQSCENTDDGGKESRFIPNDHDQEMGFRNQAEKDAYWAMTRDNMNSLFVQAERNAAHRRRAIILLVIGIIVAVAYYLGGS